MGTYNARHAANDESRNKAAHNTEPWTDDEVSFLMEWDGGEEGLALTAELLGRTIEACRQRFYETRRTNRGGVRIRITSTTITTVERLHDVCDRCWLVHGGECDR